MKTLAQTLRQAAQSLAKDKNRPLGLLPLLKLAAKEIERMDMELTISRQSEREAWRYHPELESERNRLTLSLAAADAAISKAIGHLKDCPPPFVLSRIELQSALSAMRKPSTPDTDFDF